MNFLHYEVDLKDDEVVEVTLDKQANVRLLDAANFEKYKKGEHHAYYGGRASKSPVRLPAPKSGHWHVIIDLGGYTGTVTAAVKVVRP